MKRTMMTMMALTLLFCGVAVAEDNPPIRENPPSSAKSTLCGT